MNQELSPTFLVTLPLAAGLTEGSAPRPLEVVVIRGLLTRRLEAPEKSAARGTTGL